MLNGGDMHINMLSVYNQMYRLESFFHLQDQVSRERTSKGY